MHLTIRYSVYSDDISSTASVSILCVLSGQFPLHVPHNARLLLSSPDCKL